MKEHNKKVFSCTRCGKCCSSIGATSGTDSEELDFIRENFYGSMPVIQLVPPEKQVLPLYDWEAERLKKKAEEKGIEIRVIPLQAVFDTIRKKSIIMKYALDHKRCPFLDDSNMCAVYDARPFVCKQFPFQKGPFMDDDISTDEKSFTPSKLSSGCPALEGLETEKESGSNIKALYRAFGDTFMAAMQNDLINIWMNDVMVNLMKRRIIEPLVKVEYDTAVGRIRKNPMVPLTEFLVESGQHPREEMQKLIGLFEDYNDVKEKAMELLEEKDDKKDGNRDDKKDDNH